MISTFLELAETRMRKVKWINQFASAQIFLRRWEPQTDLTEINRYAHHNMNENSIKYQMGGSLKPFKSEEANVSILSSLQATTIHFVECL